MSLAQEPLDWVPLIEQASQNKLEHLVADTFLSRSKSQSRSRPAIFLASNGLKYYVKSVQAHPLRWAVNDLVCAKVGHAINAPVLNPVVIYVDPELVVHTSELDGFRSGYCYATSHEEITDRLLFEYIEAPYNRPRFAKLAYLYGWYRICKDHQLVYRLQDPYEVLSIDHEHSIVDSGEWKLTDFPTIPPPAPHDWICNGAKLESHELEQAKNELANVEPADIARAVAAPHDNWEVTFEEQLALASYLWNRCLALRN